MKSPSTSRVAVGALCGLSIGFLLIEALAGARGSPLVPVLPPGVIVPAWNRSLAGWLHLDGLGPLALTVLALILLGALVSVFFLLLREAWHGRVATPAVLAGTLVALGLMLAGPVLLSRDVYSYAAYGRTMALHGSNPYVVTPSAFPHDPFAQVVSRLYLGTRALYGPAFLLPAAGIAKTGSGSVSGTIFGFKALAAVSLMLAAAFASAAAGSLVSRRGAAAAVVVGLNPVLVVHTAGGGHNDGLIVLFFMAAAAMAVRGMRVAASPNDEETIDADALGPAALTVTGLLVLAALVKVVVAPPLILWVWWLTMATEPSRRVRVMAAHAGLAVALGAVLMIPFYAGWRTLAPLATLSGVEGWASGPGLVARGARALGRVISGPALAGTLGKVTAVVFLGPFILLLFRLLRRIRGGSLPSPIRPWATALLALALSVPYLTPWYGAWFLPFALFLEDRGLAAAALVAGGVLALTGVPAEPAPAAALWHDMIAGVHFGAAGVMLAMFGFVLARSFRTSQLPPFTAGAITTSRSANARA